MTTLRKFEASDLFKFNHINLDPLTETYGIPFYMQYMSQWPSINTCMDDPNGRMMGYVLGKAEGAEKLWHGHVTAVTVANEYRRMGVAKRLMKSLEDVSTKVYNAFFVDLFVRLSHSSHVSCFISLYDYHCTMVIVLTVSTHSLTLTVHPMNHYNHDTLGSLFESACTIDVYKHEICQVSACRGLL